MSLGRSNYLHKVFSQAQKWQTLDNPIKEKIYAQKSSKNNLSNTESWVPCKHSWVHILHLIIKNCWYSPPFNLQKGINQMIWTITLGIPEIFLGKKISKVLILRIKSGTAFESTIVGLRWKSGWIENCNSKNSPVRKKLSEKGCVPTTGA